MSIINRRTRAIMVPKGNYEKGDTVLFANSSDPDAIGQRMEIVGVGSWDISIRLNPDAFNALGFDGDIHSEVKKTRFTKFMFLYFYDLF